MFVRNGGELRRKRVGDKRCCELLCFCAMQVGDVRFEELESGGGESVVAGVGVRIDGREEAGGWGEEG